MLDTLRVIIVTLRKKDFHHYTGILLKVFSCSENTLSHITTKETLQKESFKHLNTTSMHN